jgi:hypothetical protein
MADVKTTLKEAIVKASIEETEIVDKLAHAVLEREHGQAPRASTWSDQVALLETALLAKQRTVDVLKLALTRLPERAQTF